MDDIVTKLQREIDDSTPTAETMKEAIQAIMDLRLEVHELSKELDRLDANGTA